MYRLSRVLFALFVARPITLLLLGLNVRNQTTLQWHRPSIIVANHNSHLDTLVLIAMVPLRHVHLVRPAAASDYFLQQRVSAWFFRNCVGIVGVSRKRNGQHPLIECQEALKKGHTLILFPEGTRGEPEKMQSIKSGIALLAKQFPNVPVIPIFMHGLGRALPKGEWLLIPFFCDVFVGDTMRWQGDKVSFIKAIEQQFSTLRAKMPASWMKS